MMPQMDFEFLQRALGQSEDSGKLEITLGAFPPDLPVTLPNLPDLRVLGGVRSVQARWTFEYDYEELGRSESPPERHIWRVFLDTSASPEVVLERLLDMLLPLGWQRSRLGMFSPVFVEAAGADWLGVHASERRTLNLRSRWAEGMTQVWLTVSDVEEQQVRHFLSRHQFSPEVTQAPLPTLILPAGWQAQMQHGNGGPVHSQHYLLRPAEAIQDEDALGELWPQLLPQLERQGWRLLHREEALTVYRTPLGVGTLGLRRVGAEVVAHIVHVTDGPDDGRSSSSFTISSNS